MKYKDKNTQKLGIKYQERTDVYEHRYGYNWSFDFESKPKISLRDMYIFRCSKVKDYGWWNSLTEADKKNAFLKSKKHTMDELMDMFPGDINKKRNGRIDEILK